MRAWSVFGTAVPEAAVSEHRDTLPCESDVSLFGEAPAAVARSIRNRKPSAWSRRRSASSGAVSRVGCRLILMLTASLDGLGCFTPPASRQQRRLCYWYFTGPAVNGSSGVANRQNPSSTSTDPRPDCSVGTTRAAIQLPFGGVRSPSASAILGWFSWCPRTMMPSGCRSVRASLTRLGPSTRGEARIRAMINSVGRVRSATGRLR